MANGESVVEHAPHAPNGDVNGAKLTLEDPAVKVGSWDQGKVRKL